MRLVLSEFLYGTYQAAQWQQAVKRVPGAVCLDCRGVYDALARSASSALGLKDKKSALEAMALRESLLTTQASLR